MGKSYVAWRLDRLADAVTGQGAAIEGGPQDQVRTLVAPPVATPGRLRRAHERYGFMLPPGLFHPSHSSTFNIAGCLATYPPVRA